MAMFPYERELWLRRQQSMFSWASVQAWGGRLSEASAGVAVVVPGGALLANGGGVGLMLKVER